MMIARSILTTQGASFSLMFLYIAALFFLGTVNVLASRIFADAWVALGANLEAGIMGKSLLGLGVGTSKLIWKNKENIANGAKAVGKSMMGDGLPKRTPNLAYATPQQVNPMLNPGIVGGVDTIYGNPPSGSQRAISVSPTPNVSTPVAKTTPPYANEFSNNGFFVKQTDKQNGIYSMSGKGYSYYDEKNNLTHTFPTKKDALDSGYKESQLRQTTISKRQVVDLSQFRSGNPHNAQATKQAVSMGHKSDYAHITKRSDAIRVKHNLEMNNENFKKLGVDGYLVKHYDNPNGLKSSKRAATRIITLGKEEKTT